MFLDLVYAEMLLNELLRVQAPIDSVNLGAIQGQVASGGTAITNHFEWDEYKVVSAEKVGEKHYIYYTSLAYYTEGGQKTKLNQWVVTGRLKGAEIPAENIEK